MIIYFSATGNNEYIAKRIAKETGDVAYSMTELTQISLKEGESLGFVIPTYFWGLPSFVEDFVQKTPVFGAEHAYIYCLATYGTTTGQIDFFLGERLKERGLSLSASFSVKTVDNWTVLFDVSDKEKVARELASEKEQTGEVIEKIKARSREFISKDKKSLFMAKKARYFYERARRCKHLHVTAECIGCGACASGCPVRAIEMKDGKPVWIKEKCTMCFKCLHRCPTFAIQYEKKTQKHGQYVHPKFSD